MVQFLSIIFFSWISSIFVGFFKSSRFFVSPCSVSCRKARTLRDEIRSWLTYSTYRSLAEKKKNNVYQLHNNTVHQLYNSNITRNTSRCALTLSRSVSHAASPCPASACVSMCARPNTLRLNRVIRTDEFRSFLQPFSAEAETLPHTMPWPFSSTYVQFAVR